MCFKHALVLYRRSGTPLSLSPPLSLTHPSPPRSLCFFFYFFGPPSSFTSPNYS